jgi:poly(A) polymerase
MADRRDDAVSVVRALRDAGHVAYFAGGCVRDALLGLTPKDYDVATDAPPARVRELFKKTQAVGQAFGVILVRLGKSVIEVATFRTDGHYADGRRPSEVTFSTPQEDAQRRDFTLNGLFYDPVDDRVIDYVDGQRDLRDRVLRAIGDPAQRFAEDHLRMLRAVRFAARFDLSIDPATADAIRRDAGLLTRISGERIADELRRMLVPPTRGRAWREMWGLGLVAPALGAASGGTSSQPLREEKSLVLALPADRETTFGLALLTAAIDARWHAGGGKHDILGNLTPAEAKKIVSQCRQTLKLSNDESEEMTWIARLAHGLLNARELPVALVKRSLASPHAPAMRTLLASLRSTGAAAERIAAIEARLAEFDGVDCAPPPYITGDDLVAAGHAPGPAFKRVLDQVYDAQLEDRIADRDQAMSLATRLLAL